MKREHEIKGVKFLIENYTPRRNEFEKGLKYKLYVYDFEYGYMPTSHCFCTIREAVEFINENYFLWL